MPPVDCDAADVTVELFKVPLVLPLQLVLLSFAPSMDDLSDAPEPTMMVFTPPDEVSPLLADCFFWCLPLYTSTSYGR